jgi:hypothetical protein
MRFQYSTTDAAQDEFDALPRLPFRLRQNGHVTEVVGLVDSGATVNVLPYLVGGLLWVAAVLTSSVENLMRWR